MALVGLFQIAPTKRALRVKTLTKEWPKRTRGVRRLIAFQSAEQVKTSLLERIPRKGWDEYREALRVSRVSGDLGKADAFSVYVDPKARQVREVDEPKTLLYIRSRRRLRRAKPEIEILEKYSPWTLDTIPFTPKRADAQLVSRTATKREVRKVARARIKDRKQWRYELLKAGVPLPKPRLGGKTKLPKVVPDVAFAAMRLEFGFGVKGVPHWRPAVQDLMSSGVASFRRDPMIRGAFLKPSFTEWRSWVKIDTSTRIRVGDARKFLPFQKKLGIRSQR